MNLSFSEETCEEVSVTATVNLPCSGSGGPPHTNIYI